jgi:hypothetical protein
MRVCEESCRSLLSTGCVMIMMIMNSVDYQCSGRPSNKNDVLDCNVISGCECRNERCLLLFFMRGISLFE